MSVKGQIKQQPGVLTAYRSVRNSILNLTGVDRTFEQLLEDGDVGRALQMMEDHDSEVEVAMEEYEPEMHAKVMHRPNKVRKGREEYESEKLPRALQKHINEVELFFLLDRPIEFRNDTIVSDGNSSNSDAYDAFLRILKDSRFDSQMRTIKRTAGAFTECAHYWRVYRDEDDGGKVKVQSIVLSSDKGYRLRPMFDQYGTMVTFAWQYHIKAGLSIKQITEIETKDWHFTCSKGKGGWSVEKSKNKTGKINVIYYRQPKAWEGAQRRIERLELIDSKIADVNNYFSAPKMVVRSDMLESLPDSTKIVGEVILYKGGIQGDNSGNFVKYLEMPTAPELQRQEIDNLEKTIGIDTMTPPFDFSSLVGMGTLSGEAIQRSMMLGYLKRNLLLEIYNEMVSREVALVKAIMANITHIRYRSQLEKMDISFEFVDPFSSEDLQRAKDIAELHERGVLSTEIAVREIGMYDNQQDEIDRLNNPDAAASSVAE